MKGVLVSVWVFLCALLSGAHAQEATFSFKALDHCYSAASTFDIKYECMASTVHPCVAHHGGVFGAHGVSCIRAEAQAWRDVMELERASIADRLATERIVEGPCKDNEHGCLQGLSDLLSDGAAFQEVQCAKEALPANNAGKPELALSLCQLREDARLTIRVLQFGQRMGRFE